MLSGVAVAVVAIIKAINVVDATFVPALEGRQASGAGGQAISDPPTSKDRIVVRDISV